MMQSPIIQRSLPQRGLGVKLDNSPAWDRNLTVRVDFATTIRAWDRGLTLRVIPVATTSEVALGQEKHLVVQGGGVQV